MRERKRKPAPRERKEEQDAPEAAEHPETRERVEHTDEFLDEIDAALETNAEKFVSDYVQAGGQ